MKILWSALLHRATITSQREATRNEDKQVDTDDFQLTAFAKRCWRCHRTDSSESSWYRPLQPRTYLQRTHTDTDTHTDAQSRSLLQSNTKRC